MTNQEFRKRTLDQERCKRPQYSFELDVDKSRGQGRTTLYIDATRIGNASRFLNHACESANLVGNYVFGEHHDALELLVKFLNFAASAAAIS